MIVVWQHCDHRCYIAEICYTWRDLLDYLIFGKCTSASPKHCEGGGGGGASHFRGVFYIRKLSWFQNLVKSRVPWYRRLKCLNSIWCSLAFYGAFHLTHLILEYCNLTVLPPSRDIAKSIWKLSLENNNISHLPDHYFDDFTSLAMLQLAFNHIPVIPDLRHISRSLSLLTMDSNMLQSIPTTMYDTTYHSLSTLYLSDNQISKLTEHMLQAWPMLKYLLLMKNKFRRLENLTNFSCNLQTGKWYPTRLSMWQNPWRCDRELAWVIEMQKRPIYCQYDKIILNDIYGWVCAEPPLFKGQSISHLGRLLLRIFRTMLFLSMD